MGKIISIVAFDNNRFIGAGGKIIWQIKEDMAHFKKLTMGNICIMGRITWESIPEKFRPLAGRMNIVVSTNSDYNLPDGVLLASNLDEALELANDHAKMGEYAGRDIFICGGQQLYDAAMPHLDAIEVTEIAKSYPTENLPQPRYFPEIDPQVWYAASSEQHQTEEGLHFDFIRYEKLSTALF